MSNKQLDENRIAYIELEREQTRYNTHFSITGVEALLLANHYLYELLSFYNADNKVIEKHKEFIWDIIDRESWYKKLEETSWYQDFLEGARDRNKEIKEGCNRVEDEASKLINAVADGYDKGLISEEEVGAHINFIIANTLSMNKQVMRRVYFDNIVGKNKNE